MNPDPISQARASQTDDSSPTRPTPTASTLLADLLADYFRRRETVMVDDWGNRTDASAARVEAMVQVELRAIRLMEELGVADPADAEEDDNQRSLLRAGGRLLGHSNGTVIVYNVVDLGG